MSQLSTWKIFVAAGLGANLAEVFTIPLDTVKVRMQIYQDKWPGLGACMKDIIKNEGPLKLFNGLHAGLMRQSLFATSRIGIYDYFNTKMQAAKGKENVTILHRIGMGIVSGALGICIANPADVIKVRFQSDIRSAGKPRYSGLIDAGVKIWKNEGLSGYYGTLPVNMVRNSVTNAAELASYDQIKTTILKNEWLVDGMPLHIISSASAGFIAAFFMSPADVLKSKMQDGKPMPDGTKVNYTGMGECFRMTWKQSGFMGLYKGFNASCQRIVSWNTLMFVFREQFLIMFANNQTK